jgi:DNA invertase Pin-like site-specific DNA recombinase
MDRLPKEKTNLSPKKITKPLDVYVRVSRVGGRDGESYITEAVQEERCRALAQARGLTVGEVFTDRDQSGGKMERPEFAKALARIERGLSGGIIVARLDRFARTLLGGLQTLEQIREAGGVVLTAEGEFDTSTNTGELTLNLMLTLAQFELRRIRESWEVAKERAVERGVHIGAPPAGYHKRADGALEPSEHAPAVRQAFEMRAKGASQADISRHLVTAGVPTSSSRQASSSWSIRAVQLLLENRVYLGEARSGAYVKKDAHMPLVTRALFRAVQDRKGTARAASKNGGDGPLLGGGLLRCASCGCRLSRDWTTVHGKKYAFYRCKSNPSCPARVSISARKIEPYLEGIVKRFLAGAVYEPEQRSDERDALRMELAEAEEELRELVESEEPIPASVLAARGKVLQARVVAAEEALERAEAAQESPLTFPTSAEAWEALSVPEQRTIITALLGRVVVRKGRGLDVAERIERPDAPDDGARPAALLGEDDKVKLVERFAELLRQEQAAGHTLL